MRTMICGLPVEEDLVIVNRNDSLPIFERTNLIGLDDSPHAKRKLHLCQHSKLCNVCKTT